MSLNRYFYIVGTGWDSATASVPPLPCSHSHFHNIHSVCISYEHRKKTDQAESSRAWATHFLNTWTAHAQCARCADSSDEVGRTCYRPPLCLRLSALPTFLRSFLRWQCVADPTGRLWKPASHNLTGSGGDQDIEHDYEVLHDLTWVLWTKQMGCNVEHKDERAKNVLFIPVNAIMIIRSRWKA